MSLNKAIEHGKEHRKPYKGGKKYCRSCRNHGSCNWCKGNRLHKFRDKQPPLDEELDLVGVTEEIDKNDR